MKGITKIAITYASNSDAADETIAQIHKINSDIKATAIQADVVSETFAQDVVEKTLRDLDTKTIDVVVNNAAYVGAKQTLPISKDTKDNFINTMIGNSWSAVQLFLVALPHIPRGGRVIMIGSSASKGANTDPVVCYGASKAALDSFTRSLALQFSAKHGITINSVSVGATMTDLIRVPIEVGAIPQEFIDSMVSKMTAEHRIGEVEDIAGVVGFLASEESRWVNGNNVPANGGSMLESQG